MVNHGETHERGFRRRRRIERRLPERGGGIVVDLVAEGAASTRFADELMTDHNRALA